MNNTYIFFNIEKLFVDPNIIAHVNSLLFIQWA